MSTQPAPLLPCPCGSTPTKLHISGEHHGPKWAHCTGDCCGEWSIEYRNNYTPLDTPETMELAVAAWNEATRAKALADGRTACVRVMTEDECRAEFEVWAKLRPLYRDCLSTSQEHPGHYADLGVEMAWMVWLACAHAMGAVR